MKSRASRFIVLLMCLSVTSVTYALELLPAADAAARRLSEPTVLILLGLTLLAAAHHARKRLLEGSRVRLARAPRPARHARLRTAPEAR